MCPYLYWHFVALWAAGAGGVGNVSQNPCLGSKWMLIRETRGIWLTTAMEFHGSHILRRVVEPPRTPGAPRARPGIQKPQSTRRTRRGSGRARQGRKSKTQNGQLKTDRQKERATKAEEDRFHNFDHICARYDPEYAVTRDELESLSRLPRGGPGGSGQDRVRKHDEPVSAPSPGAPSLRVNLPSQCEGARVSWCKGCRVGGRTWRHVSASAMSGKSTRPTETCLAL